MSQHVVRALSGPQRRRVARRLIELSVASLRIGRDPGDFLPAPGQVSIEPQWLDSVARLRDEILRSDSASEETAGALAAQRKLLFRLNHELLLARDTRARALRCLRMARLLRPGEEEVELAFLYLRAQRRMTRSAGQAMRTLAMRATNRSVAAKAWLGAGAIHLELDSPSRALSCLQKSLSIRRNDPETLARAAYAALACGREDHAARCLDRCVRIVTSRRDEAAQDAVAFLKSPAHGFPRLFVSSPETVAHLRAKFPAFTLELLDAVQRSALETPKSNSRIPRNFLGYARRRLRVAWAAFVVNTGNNHYEILDSSGRDLHASNLGNVDLMLSLGGPGGVMIHCAEVGEPVITRLQRDDPARVLADARGAAAAPVESAGLPPTYLVVESRRPLTCDLSALADLAESAVGPACAIWLARESALRSARQD
jgi:tetratricopeptide (TPR) repeat protein